MRCTLFVPDLFWPGDDAAEVCQGLAARTLETLLARSDRHEHPPVAPEAWLCQAFEVERQQDWPVASITLPLHGVDPADAYWLRADPVHLQLQRDRVAVMANVGVSAEEAAACIAALNAHFAADGLTFSAPVPGEWYLRLATGPLLATATLATAAGRHARDIQPTGREAARWRAIVNEIQMVMHALPLNAARGARGEPEVNSVWLWGGGRKTRVPGRTFQAVWSAGSLGQALGVHADAHAAPLPADGDAWVNAARALPADAHHLVVIDACARAAAYGDAYGWREAVTACERDWLAPLARALRRGTLSRLTLAVTAPQASWHYELGPRHFWKLWRPVRALAAYGRP